MESKGNKTKRAVAKKTTEARFVEPATVSFASGCDSSDYTASRRNRASTINRTDNYKNIEEGVIPFNYSQSNGNYSSNIDLKDAIILCQKAYYNIAIFRNTIDLMTEFSISKLFWRKGNAQSKKFFKAWEKRVNIWSLQDKFFREYFRSGNVFLYKMNANFSKSENLKLKEIFGEEKEYKDITLKYIILNPADIQIGGSASFVNAKYFKILNEYEVYNLKNPKTEEDKKIAEYIDKNNILKNSKKSSDTILLPLDLANLSVIFYKKQDYEPMSVPMGFPVLADINWKLELKKIDMAISRTVQQVVLLVTMGDEKMGSPPEGHINAMQKIFKNESVGRVLVSDYTTKVQFIIPQIGDILDPKKYEMVNNDILLGLNNVLFSEDKFANSSIKVDIFLARLENARQAFLNDFLIPEVERIGRNMGFKDLPVPHLQTIDLKNDVVRDRIYAQLMQMGILTPEEGLKAIEKNILPTKEESIESQKEYKELREKGYYEPIIGKKENKESGRPVGTSSPQTTKMPGKIGNGPQSTYSCEKMIEVSKSIGELCRLVETKLKDKYGLKKLNKEQKALGFELASVVVQNENKEDWINNLDKYIENPSLENEKVFSEVLSLATEHGLEPYPAAILYHSKI